MANIEDLKCKTTGILLWVRVRDKAQEDLAVKLMKGHSGRNVHVQLWSE